MIKFLLYTALFTTGSYLTVTHLPDSYKQKMLAAIGMGNFEGKTFQILNPSARRSEILTKLEDNISKIKEIQDLTKVSNTTGESSGQPAGEKNKINSAGIQIDGPPEPPQSLQSLLEDQKIMIEELKNLNPQTGVIPKITEKILGLKPAITAEQITPELKAQVCP